MPRAEREIENGREAAECCFQRLPREENQTDGEKSKADEPFTSKYSLSACHFRNSSYQQTSSFFHQPSLTRIEFAHSGAAHTDLDSQQTISTPSPAGW
jgi:hypothetical protein